MPHSSDFAGDVREEEEVCDYHNQTDACEMYLFFITRSVTITTIRTVAGVMNCRADICSDVAPGYRQKSHGKYRLRALLTYNIWEPREVSQ